MTTNFDLNAKPYIQMTNVPNTVNSYNSIQKQILKWTHRNYKIWIEDELKFY